MRVKNITKGMEVDSRELGNFCLPFLEIHSGWPGLKGSDRAGPERTLNEMQTLKFLPDSE